MQTAKRAVIKSDYTDWVLREVSLLHFIRDRHNLKGKQNDR